MPNDSTSFAQPVPTPAYRLQSPRQELEAFALRRLETLRRVDSDEAERVEAALMRAVELLEEAEADDDPA